LIRGESVDFLVVANSGIFIKRSEILPHWNQYSSQQIVFASDFC